MDDIAELQRLLENIIRPGHVMAVDGKRVRVESGELQTNWIRWITLSAGEDRDWHPPTTGEQVLLLSPGGDLANGYALRGIYSDANDAPSTNPAERLFEFRDGTKISYNTATHLLLAEIIGSAGISTTGDLAAIVEGQADIEVTGALNATAASIEATATGAAKITAGSAEVTAPTITFNGAVTINGPLNLNGPLTALPGAGGAGGASIQGDVSIEGNVDAAGIAVSGDITAANVTASTEVTAAGVTLTSRLPL